MTVTALELAVRATKWKYDKVKETKCELFTRSAVPVVITTIVAAGNGGGGEYFSGAGFIAW